MHVPRAIGVFRRTALFPVSPISDCSLFRLQKSSMTHSNDRSYAGTARLYHWSVRFARSERNQTPQLERKPKTNAVSKQPPVISHYLSGERRSNNRQKAPKFRLCQLLPFYWLQPLLVIGR